MTKFQKLERYAQVLKDKLDSPTPSKQANRVEAYKAFLLKDLKTVESQMYEMKVAGTDKKV